MYRRKSRVHRTTAKAAISLWAFAVLVPTHIAQAQDTQVTYDADGYAEVPIPCPIIHSSTQTFRVRKLSGTGAVPFTTTTYVQQEGIFLIGTSWYHPSPTTTTVRGATWEWLDSGVFARCYESRYLFGAIIIAWWDPSPLVMGHAIPVVPETPGGGGGGGGDENGGGGGENGSACDDLKLEPGSGCYDIYVDGVWTNTICC